MARVFRLGNFFGLTASQLVLFTPEKFNKLLQMRYTEYIREGLYSLIKEFEYLKNVFASDDQQPDYDILINTFRINEYLGVKDSDTDAKIKMKIAKFFRQCKDNVPMSDLCNTYGIDVVEYKEVVNIINETMTIDVVKCFEGVSSNALKLIKILYGNMSYLNTTYKECVRAYNESNIKDKVIAGRSIRDILSFDRGTKGWRNQQSCFFVSQMYSRVNTLRNEIELSDVLEKIETDIRSIQNEYHAKEIVYTPVDEIRDALNDVYSEMTIDRFNEITELNLTIEEADNLFLELDEYLIGGLGFNSREMGEEVCESIANEDTSSWTSKEIDRNPKLDSVLRIAYLDLKSKEFMQTV